LGAMGWGFRVGARPILVCFNDPLSI